MYKKMWNLNEQINKKKKLKFTENKILKYYVSSFITLFCDNTSTS